MPIRRSGSEPVTLTWEPWLLIALLFVGLWMLVGSGADGLLSLLGVGWRPARLVLLIACEAAVTVPGVWAVMWVWRRFAPNRAVGMAKRHEIRDLLGRDALWRSRWLLRPDLYPKPNQRAGFRLGQRGQ